MEGKKIKKQNLNLDISTPGNLQYGETFEAQVGFEPINGKAVTVLLRNSEGQVIEEVSGETPSVQIPEPSALGQTELVARTEHKGKTFERTKTVYFSGNPVTTQARTKSYIQYEMDTIQYEYTVENTQGDSLSPDVLDNIHFQNRVTNGEVTEQSFEYLGNGEYRVDAEVDGHGTLTSEMCFSYKSKSFCSEKIEVTVKPNEYSIDTSEMPTSATLGDRKTLQFKVLNPKGVAVNPENLHVNVYYPDGTTVSQVNQSQLHRVETGVYEFNYKFDQVQKYTFEVVANSPDTTQTSSRASVAVGEPEPKDNKEVEGAQIYGFVKNNLVFIAAGFILLIAGAWYGRRKINQ